jgi:hypothetical protein
MDRGFFDVHDFAAEQQLLQQLRNRLISNANPVTVVDGLSFTFDPKISQTYITLFQAGERPLRWGSRRDSLAETLVAVCDKLRSMERFAVFSIADPMRCRLMMEVVTSSVPCDIRALTALRFSENRFDAGLDGLKYRYQNVTRFFMPTDAVVHSIMGVKQLLNFLAKQTGVAKRTNKISERAQLMRREPIAYELLRSVAFITQGQRTIPLFRGYPMPVDDTAEAMRSATLKSIDWLLANMRSDGSFLYYYDPVKDTVVDHDHPGMLDPLYYNILRHSGGTITLLRGFELTGEPAYLTGAKRSVDYLVSTFREHRYHGDHACYPFFNKKSKLGGAGIGLVAMVHYYRLSGDDGYRAYLDGLVRHLLSQVEADGEMLGYFIHPLHNKGKPIRNPSNQLKMELFSFYYPGEALLGLALYYRHVPGIAAELKAEIHQKSMLALDFLVDIRPQKYAHLFDVLPADAWLMQAIEEWVKVDGFGKQSYIDFVFSDTQQMFDHMYTEMDEVPFDYVGGFYYHFGDHVYHDASRCEGIVSAYYLANYLGDEARAQHILANMLKSARGLMHTYNSSSSTYAHRFPEKALHSFRFKLTRQWVRVDSVQHAACFFARLLTALPKTGGG